MLDINQPDGPAPPSVDLRQVMRDVDAVIGDMKAARVWVFNGGLHPPSKATVVRLEGGEVLMTDGPYAEGREHIGGLCIINAPGLDAPARMGSQASASGHPPDRGATVPSGGRGPIGDGRAV